MIRHRFKPFVILSILLSVHIGNQNARADIVQLEKDFRSPPDSARPLVRWWWFGPAVTKDGIDRELKSMKSLGFGGVEVQPTYPLALDSPAGTAAEMAVKNLKFMSPEFLDMLSYSATRCKDLGLRMDLTIGSGWPYGGPAVTAADSAIQLEPIFTQSPPGQKIVKPNVPNGRVLFAAFVAPLNTPVPRGRGAAAPGGASVPADLSAFRRAGLQKDNSIELADDLAATGAQLLLFTQRENIMQVKRPANGAEGPVLDHLNHDAVARFIQNVAEPEIKACGSKPPYAIFCDSLEVNNENWTPDFLAEFNKRRGYDLMPYLPALVGNIGEKTADIRYDYGKTVTELFTENFNAQMTALAHKYNTRFRIQGYGSPAATLASYASADLPEGELQQNFDFHNFRATRYAASASQLLGQNVTSAEAFTWLHGAPFRATPIDIKGEADQHFLDGINQLVCHGWPYTPDGIAYPGASFYAAAVFDEQNPWSIAMPDINAYLSRCSQLLRAGKSVNDVAIYLPEADLYAKATNTFSSMNAAWSDQSNILSAIQNAGLNADAIDDAFLANARADGKTLTVGDAAFQVVVLPPTENMPLETAHALDAFVQSGGTVLAVGRTPTHVPGFKAAAWKQSDLAATMKHIAPAPLPNADALTTALRAAIPADVTFTPPLPAAGFVHRHTDDADIYFIANASNQPLQTYATFRAAPSVQVEQWNAITGQIAPAPHPFAGARNVPAGLPPGSVRLDLGPYASTICVLTRRRLASPMAFELAPPPPMDISSDWHVSFKGHGPAKQFDMKQLTSWTQLEGMANFSGVATYERTITLGDLDTLGDSRRVMTLSLGEAQPQTPAGGRGTQGFAAALDPPVHDAAVVTINGIRAGAIWCAPYSLDITALMKPNAENSIRIDVANTAVNYLSTAGFPNYDLQALRRAYGNRFDPQGTLLYAQPLPSGLTGPISLKWSAFSQ